MGAEGLGGIFRSITKNSLLQECKAQGRCRVERRSKAGEVDRLAAEVPYTPWVTSTGKPMKNFKERHDLF